MNKSFSTKPIHIVELALLVGLAVWLLCGGLSLRRQDRLAEQVVRLHVLANSDSQADQALKLEIRDHVLDWTTELLAHTENRQEAEALLRGNLLEIEAEAAREVRRLGYEYPVRVELTQAEFPTKEYDGFTLPAGQYLALRVLIGEAAGHNWWCVLFPPLCTAAATDLPACALSKGLGEEELKLITEENQGYVLKFKSVELWEGIKSRLNW